MQDIKQTLKSIDIINSNEDFKKIASKLINEYVIEIDKKEFSMTEIEFYYHSKKHPDSYVHKNDLQKEFGTFYVHQKDGTRGGIDLVLGNEENDVYCGVLIRGLKDSSGNYISGPNNVKQKVFCEILAVANNYKDIQNIINEKAILKKQKTDLNENIYHSTRVGLSKKSNDNLFISKLHRFIAYDTTKHKYKEKEKVKEFNNEEVFA